MDEHNYTDLYKLQFADLTGRTPFCPEDQEIAEYFDGELAETEHSKLEHHLTACRFCLARIGVLERLEQNSNQRRIPESVLATAKQMSPRVPVRRPRLAPAWASAAVLVIALFFIVTNNQSPAPVPGSESSAVPSSGENSRQLRSVKRDAIDLDVLIPAQGSDIQPGSLIQWAAVPGNLHYNIYVLSRAGDVLWTERLGGTEWELQESLHLAAGNKYYFRVEASLADGRTVSSKHVVFGIAEPK